MNHLSSNRKKVTIAIALIAIIAASTGIYLQNNPTTQAALISPHLGLVGGWDFNEGVGNIARDISGNGNDGSINGATWASGEIGQALSFNGASNYVSIPDVNSLDIGTGNLTLTSWFYVSSLPSAYQDIISKGGHGYVGYGLCITNNNKVAASITASGGINQAAESSNTIVVGWNYAACVFARSDKIYVYLNGVATSINYASGNSGGSLTNSYALRIGAFSPLNILWFSGTIDEVHVYNRALSATEIQADFQNPDFSSNLVAKVPKGTTQAIFTLSWQGTGSINATITAPPALTYTEDLMSTYQKTSYSTTDGLSSMLNIKRLSVSVTALPTDQNWNISLVFDNVGDYQISVEAQK
jgi:hypothetical protein